MDFYFGTAHKFQVGLKDISKKFASNTDKSIKRKSISHKHKTEQDCMFYSGAKGRGGVCVEKEGSGDDNESPFLPWLCER